jgi:hypothetical protein
MPRIHAPFDEPTLEQIDLEVKKRGVIRTQWLSSAICSYLRLLELTKGAGPSEMVLDRRNSRPQTRAGGKRTNNSRGAKKEHCKTRRKRPSFILHILHPTSYRAPHSGQMRMIR